MGLASRACILALVAGAAACFGSLDGLSGNDVADAGDAEADGALPSDATSGDAGREAGAPPPGAPLDLQGSVASGSVVFSEPGRFDVAFSASNGWQLDRWIDRVVDPTRDLASKNYDAGTPIWHTNDLVGGLVVEADLGGSTTTWFSAEEGASDVTAVVRDERPARVALETTVTYAQIPVVQTLTYTAYASGRVIVAETLSTTSDAASYSLKTIEYPHVSVDSALTWVQTKIPVNGRQAVALSQPKTGTSQILVVNRSTDGATGDDSATGANLYWTTSSVVVTTSTPFVRDCELQVDLAGQPATNLAARATDALTPELTIIGGATVSGTGFDAATGSYVVRANGGAPVAFHLGTLDRFSPVFTVEGWTSATFTVKLGADVLVTNAAPQNGRASAWRDAGAGRVVVALTGDVPVSLPVDQRTFTITP